MAFRLGRYRYAAGKAGWMDEKEFLDQSFIVKIWQEDVDGETGRKLWRGRVTHVPSGAYANFTSLAALLTIIEPYLEAWDIRREPSPPTRRPFRWWHWRD